MEQNAFPGNSKHIKPPSDQAERPKQIIKGNVVRRKVPLGKRMTRNILGGDVQSVWGYVFGEVLVPAARDMIADAVGGGVERMLFPDSAPRARRSRSRGSSVGHTPYNQMTGRSRSGGRDLGSRGRSSHSFDEIILDSRSEAQEALIQMEERIDRYEFVSVADLFAMVGITSNHVDLKWGWTDLSLANVRHVSKGYLLNLPKPEPID